MNGISLSAATSENDKENEQNVEEELTSLNDAEGLDDSAALGNAERAIEHSEGLADDEDDEIDALIVLSSNDSIDVSTHIPRAVLRYAACAVLNSCTLGYDLGVNTSASLLVKRSMSLSSSQIELFVGAMDFFAMIGATCAHLISDKYGRKILFALSAAGFVVGTIIMASSNSYSYLIIGRAIVGLCVGFGLAVDPIYISEVSPPNRRGELVAWSEVAVNIGITFGFVSGLIFYQITETFAWRCMFGVGLLLPIVMLIFLSLPGFVPESPRWLVQNGKIEEATRVLRTIYPPQQDIDAVVKEVEESIRTDSQADGALGWAFLLRPTPAYKRMLLVGVGTALAQQLCGIDAIGAFLVFIMDDSGIKSRLSQSLILIGLQIAKLAAVIVASKMFDLKGRRFFIFVSLLGMAASLIILSLSFMYGSTVIIVCSLASYLVFFSLGMGPMAWLIPSEVFTNTIRAKAMSLAILANRLTGSVYQSTFLTLEEILGRSGFFFILALICTSLCLWFYKFLPETKGKALEDMAIYFAKLTDDSSVLDMEAEFVETQRNVPIPSEEQTKHECNAESLTELDDSNNATRQNTGSSIPTDLLLS